MAKVNYLQYLEESDQERVRAIYETVREAADPDWEFLLKVDRAGEHVRRMMKLTCMELVRFGCNRRFYAGEGPEVKTCLPLSATISGINKRTGNPDTPIGELITAAMSLRVSKVPGFEPEELNDAEWLMGLWLRSVAAVISGDMESDFLFAVKKLFKACRLHAKNLQQATTSFNMEDSCLFLRDGVRRMMASADSMRADVERQEALARALAAQTPQPAEESPQ